MATTHYDNAADNSAFNAQGSRVITVVVQLGGASENICGSSGGAQEKGKRQDETQFTTKIDGFLAGLFSESQRCCLFLTLRITLTSQSSWN